ncbi:MAG: hypothetical protein VX727_08200 [Planctomycetota bacterium]|nr:hypothetical protein [Planctomycetota bacterium]
MTTHPTHRRTKFMLASTAMAMAAGILLLIGQSPEPRVEAGLVASDDTFTLMTAAGRTGNGDGQSDLLYVIDNDNGVLLAYRATQNGPSMNITLVDGGLIGHLFDAVRP